MITETEARNLLRDYTATIDRGKLRDWPNFFTETCLYRIATRENEERGLPLSIMLCNNRPMLFDRVESTETANVFEPHHYRHILSDTEVVGASDDVLETRTGFICVRVMLDGSTTLFLSGEYHDAIVRANGRCFYRSKNVVLDQSRIDTLIAIPL